MLKKSDMTIPPIIMLPIAQLHLAKEAPKGTDLTVRDSSSGSPLTDAELKASIYASGIIQPLIWKEVANKRYVVAGNRRLRFLREIYHDAPATTPVQTQNVDDFGRDWREIAMDTNLALPPHLVERYEVIVALTKDLKLSPEDARLRWGMTPRQFNQVMALGKMSPTVRAAWKAGEIDAKTAQTFTLESDPKEQDKILAAGKREGRVNDFFVKHRIIPANQQEAGKLVAFVGVDVCRDAKILKQEDLFETNHMVTDLKTLKKMATIQISEACDSLTKDGWAWALWENELPQSAYMYGTQSPDGKGDKFSDEQKKKLGCILKISNSGELEVSYGRIKPGERKPTERKKPKQKSGNLTDSVLTNALAERLSEQLQKAGAEALKADHAVATAAVIAAISTGGHILNIRAVNSSGDDDEKAFSTVFAGALKATPQQREAMFAQIAAQAISIIVHNGAGQMPLDDEGLVDLFEAMNGGRVTKAIFDAFDAKDYFASISMPAIVEAVRCSMGDEHASKVAKMKKPDAAKFAAANLKNYLPKQLRTEWYTGPVESVTEKELTKLGKKAPKKAAVKKAAKKKAKK